MRCGEFCRASCEISSEMSPLICGPVVAGGPGDQDLRFGEQQRAQAVGLDLQLGDVGAQAELRFAWRAARVRISRIAATTVKPSSASAVVSTANS